jgi:hypothetical protein
VFIQDFVSLATRQHPSLDPIPISADAAGPACEMTLTTDSMLNFSQIAVLACQRAQGERNKAMREAWVRLCGTYQSKGGVLAVPEVRSVSDKAKVVCRSSTKTI